MSQNFPEDLSLGYGLVALCQMTGARSSWLQKGTALIDSNLPFAESRIEKMALIIDEMATSYAKVGREMETSFFGFENHYLLAICERSLRVVLLFPADEEHEDLTAAITAARRFLRKNRPKILSTFEATQAIFLKAGESPGELPDPAPSPTPRPSKVTVKKPSPQTDDKTWTTVAPALKDILATAMTPLQAQKLIDRVLSAHTIPQGPDPDEILEISREIFRKIAVPTQREQLSKKLESYLTSAGVS